ncbi:MAG: prepilin-type N-terminal cleavage/methylation domain-containing protein [Deltaproteobacteria bacterium]|nr:prepilin-type N-terminal cleavage/methylation domain-containing protein [Deltaproteobacteria bacterium]
MKNKKWIKNEKGFTLIEIIAVIIIMGILAAVAVPKFFSMQEDAKRATLNGGLSEASARFNHAYARFILDSKRAPTGVAELHTAAYLGAAAGTVGTGEDIGDFLVTWRDNTASEANSILIYIESAPGIITDWTGLDTYRQTVISSITWYS